MSTTNNRNPTSKVPKPDLSRIESATPDIEVENTMLRRKGGNVLARDTSKAYEDPVMPLPHWCPLLERVRSILRRNGRNAFMRDFWSRITPVILNDFWWFLREEVSRTIEFTPKPLPSSQCSMLQGSVSEHPLGVDASNRWCCSLLRCTHELRFFHLCASQKATFGVRLTQIEM